MAASWIWPGLCGPCGTAYLSGVGTRDIYWLERELPWLAGVGAAMKSFKIYCHIVVRIFIDLQDCTYFYLLLSVVRTYILSDVRESNCQVLSVAWNTTPPPRPTPAPGTRGTKPGPHRAAAQHNNARTAHPRPPGVRCYLWPHYPTG